MASIALMAEKSGQLARARTAASLSCAFGLAADWEMASSAALPPRTVSVLNNAARPCGDALAVLISPTNFVAAPALSCVRSEEHTSELQSQSNLVCRLLLEKKTRTR